MYLLKTNINEKNVHLRLKNNLFIQHLKDCHLVFFNSYKLDFTQGTTIKLQNIFQVSISFH